MIFRSSRTLLIFMLMIGSLAAGADMFAQETAKKGSDKDNERAQAPIRLRRDARRSVNSPGKERRGKPPVVVESHGESRPEMGNAKEQNSAVTMIDRARARYDKPREAMEFFRMKRLPGGLKDIPVEKYLEADERMKRMTRYSSLLDRKMTDEEVSSLTNTPAGIAAQTGVWQSLGPGNIGGRTRALLINPQNPDVLYAAGVSGGVWKSVNGGASWSPIADLIGNITVSALAMEPGNPETIYIGTGEGVAVFSRDTQGDFRGAGILKSTDGGNSWTRLESTIGEDFYFVNDLVISPNDKNRLYAATRSGVWRSVDAGVSWIQVLNPKNDFNETVLGGCLDLAIRTDQQTDYIFASCGTFENASLYRNTDASGAGVWSPVLAEDGMGRTALAISPSNQNVVYALASSVEFGPYELALYAVFRSDSGGASGTWTPVLRNTSSNKFNTSILSIPQLAVGSDCGFTEFDDFFGQGWYDLVIAVDPLDSNRVWAGGIDIFRSDDGGANWGVAGPAYANTNFELGPIHPDQHVIVFHPQYDGATNQTMYVGNDGGLYRTDNARGAVAQGIGSICNQINVGVKWKSINNNYGVTQFYHGVSMPDGKSFFGGTQDNGTVLGTDSGGIDGWKEINGGDGGYVAVDPTDPKTLFASYTGISIRKSTDGGLSFGNATSGIGSDDSGFFITPYVMDPSEPQRLWTGGDYIWRTTNGAARWERASALTAGSTKVGAIGVAPTDSNKVLIGMGDGFILRNDAALESGSSTTWAFSRPRAGYVSSIAFDPNNKDIAYATYSTFGGSHIWRSIDGGALWTSIDGQGNSGIPDIPVHAIAIDPSNTARLYVGTDVGVFVSNDGGASWAVENTGFANVITETLQLRVIGGVTMIYAFTHGRGAWRVPINNSGCNFGLAPSTREVKAGSSTGTVSVTASPAGCNWSVTSNASWLSVNGGGSSDGQVNFTVEENSGFKSRTGTATIAGRSFTVIQEGRDDVDVPAIAITSPPGAVTGNTSGVISLAGTARDNRGVTVVRWRNDRGLSGVAQYDSAANTWSADGVPLAVGLNNITVSAEDESGNIGRATIEVSSVPQSILVTVAGTGNNGNSGDGGHAARADLSRPIRIDIDKAGNLYLTDSDNNTVRKVSSNGIITTIAGIGSEGFTGDGGPATQAQLNFPIGVAVDGSGNIYICDNLNSAIRKVTASTGIISTLAGNGFDGYGGDGGPAAGSILNNPQNVALDAAGNLYISDFGNNRIRMISAADGMISTVAGTGTQGFSGDGGQATAAQINFPNNVWVDNAGNLIISDAGNNRIRKVNAADGVISTIAGNGARGFAGDGGPALDAQLFGPACAITDQAGNLYFSDRSNHRVRKVAVDTGIITTIAGQGSVGFSGDGLAATASALNSPTGLAFDPLGRLHIADRQNRRVRRLVNADSNDLVPPVIAITQPVTTPTFMTGESGFMLAGTASDNIGLSQIFWSNDRGSSGQASGLEDWAVVRVPLLQGENRITVTAWDINGNAKSATLTVTFSPPQIITTFAGLGSEGNTGDYGAALAARLSFPSGIAFDAQGNLYIAEAGNHRVRKVTPGGLIETFAGSGMLGASGDGGPAIDARLNEPTSVAVDQIGNVYIADNGNNRIRRVSPHGVITTFAGTGIDGFSGDGGQASQARLNLPIGVAVDQAGNLLIADAGNLRVRKVNATTGIIATIAGDGRVGFGGDGGPATQAQFRFPFGITVDKNGVIYLLDAADHRVRAISPNNGIISTYVGTGDPDFGGDGGPATQAQINFASYIKTDSDGNLYIADYANNRIRKVALATGIISTVAGTGVGAFGGDGSSPLLADLNLPNDIAFDAQGSLYIADYRNHRVRKVITAGAFFAVTGVSAASYKSDALASESIVAAFGPNLAPSIQSAGQIPLPVDLAGTTVKVRDNEGIERLSPLFFVAPGQINFQIPPSTANGLATITVSSGSGALSSGTARIAYTAPGIFSANADGQGVAAGVILRIKADGSQVFESMTLFDAASNRFVGQPVDLGPEGDQVFLILFGTGARFRSSPSIDSATIGGQPAELLFVGAQGAFVGLDQINLRLDRSLIGRGEVEVKLAIDGRESNPVTLLIK